MDKKQLSIIIATMFLTVMAIIGYRAYGQTFGGAVAYQTAPSFYKASSTAFTLTTASQRLLATSTPTKRLAATIQPINCTVSTSTVFVVMNNDVAAVNHTGFAVFGTTTATFGDYPNMPVVQGSVQGIVNNGTCTVLVTEWRSQY